MLGLKSAVVKIAVAQRLSRSASTIINVKGREIMDSRGNPTVEVEVTTNLGMFRASVPSGASTGIHEATELRDGDAKRFNGKGVLNAVNFVNTEIAQKIKGVDVTKQADLDNFLCELDGTPNKSRLGANAIVGVSLAVARAGAAANKVPLYQHFANLAGNTELVLPVPSFNVINGGKHAGNRLAFQEFMIIPVGAANFKDAVRMGSEVYHMLKTVIKAKYGQDACNVGDEGGFAPSIQSIYEGMDLLTEAIKKAGYEKEVKIGMDAAASEFKTKDGKYDLDFKNPQNDNSRVITGSALTELYVDLINKYPIILVEDPFDEDDWTNFTEFTKKVGKTIEVVGDDLLVTNVKRIQQGIEKKAVNSLLLKVNQIGTITESIAAVNLAKQNNWRVFTSHRSGETEDNWLADLAVGLSTGKIKTGAPCRSERLSKYNQLMRIEEELGSGAKYAGNWMSAKK